MYGPSVEMCIWGCIQCENKENSFIGMLYLYFYVLSDL